MILVDSNILIDVWDNDPNWSDWSIDQLTGLAANDQLAVNQIVFAEVAPRIGSLAEFKTRLTEFEIAYEPFSDEASFAAGVAFLAFRTRSTGAKMVLPDFFIGGHAQSLGATILTRDPRFYRAYFPTVPLIAPSKDEE